MEFVCFFFHLASFLGLLWPFFCSRRPESMQRFHFFLSCNNKNSSSLDGVNWHHPVISLQPCDTTKIHTSPARLHILSRILSSWSYISSTVFHSSCLPETELLLQSQWLLADEACTLVIWNSGTENHFPLWSISFLWFLKSYMLPPKKINK